MGKSIVHFLDHPLPSKPPVIAAIHDTACPVVMQWPLEVGQRRQVRNGWLQRFGSAETLRNALSYHRRFYEKGSRVEEKPGCCKEG